MGKVVVEEKKKKKKGRPSLIDIQKRNLALQKHQNQQKIPKSKKSPISNPHRRFTRRNPNPEAIATDNDDDDDDDDDNNSSRDRRRKKKLNHVLRAKNSPYLDLGLYGSDSNEEEERQVDDDEKNEEEEEESPVKKKRKINVAAISDGSAKKEGEKQSSAWKATEKQQHIGSTTPLVSGPTTPLPDKNLLVFILDRIQKKDTYGVYSEPVDPNELPDYHEIIENPMDFGTVRKKLEKGAYANLEQFENDVLLICSNAMEYNAPDTIYFRQARTMQELAKKNFENLRLDSDNEHKPKIVRRGRPPKKPLGKTSSERDSLDAIPVKEGDNAVWSNSYNLRKGHLPDKYVSADASRRAPYGSRNNGAYNWLPEHKFDKSDEFSGSSMKGFSMKYGKKQFVFDESRRSTYINSQSSVVGSDSSVLNTFCGEIKQLVPVAVHNELGYARSLARFAANLGPVAWQVASKKIERALPRGMKFGPGWIGDDDPLPVQTSTLATSSPCPLLQQKYFSSTQIPPSTALPPRVELKGDILLRHEFADNSSLDGYPNIPVPSTAPSSSTIVSRSAEPIAEPLDAATRLNDGGLGLMNSGSGGIRPPFQIHQSPLINPAINGFSGGFVPNLSSEMGKQLRPAWSAGNFSSDNSVNARILDMVSKSSFIHSTPTNHSELYNSKLPTSSSTINSGNFMTNSILEGQAGTGVGFHAQTYWNGLPPPQKLATIPPDLNLRFQSPGSPSSSVRVDSPQPDLALQL